MTVWKDISPTFVFVAVICAAFGLWTAWWFAFGMMCGLLFSLWEIGRQKLAPPPPDNTDV